MKRGKQWLPKLQVTVGEIPSPQTETAYSPAAMEARCSASYEESPKASEGPSLKNVSGFLWSRAWTGFRSWASARSLHPEKEKPSQGWRWRRNENQRVEQQKVREDGCVPGAHCTNTEAQLHIPGTHMKVGCGAVCTCTLVQGWGTDTSRFQTLIVRCQDQLVSV